MEVSVEGMAGVEGRAGAGGVEGVAGGRLEWWN